MWAFDITWSLSSVRYLSYFWHSPDTEENDIIYLLLNLLYQYCLPLLERPSWSYGRLIYNYLCSQCLSPLTLWVWTPLRRGELDTTLCAKVCQWLAPGLWFSPGTLVSSTNKTDHRDITEILLKVALNTINQTYINIVFLLYLICGFVGPSWTWSYGSWIYNYLCNQCLSPLTMGVGMPLRSCNIMWKSIKQCLFVFKGVTSFVLL